MEIAIKTGLGKLKLSMPYREWMNRAIADPGSTILAITVECADVQGSLPYHHRDPFDRMLIAQAQVENIPLGGGSAPEPREACKTNWHQYWCQASTGEIRLGTTLTSS